MFDQHVQVMWRDNHSKRAVTLEAAADDAAEVKVWCRGQEIMVPVGSLVLVPA